MALSKITVSKREKGYREAKSSASNILEGYIFKRLLDFSEDRLCFLALSRDVVILYKIREFASQWKPGEGQPFREAFLPQGFEEVEASSLSDGDFLRYAAYRYRYNTYPLTKVLEDYPPCVQIEPTSVCNFRCVMCYQADKTFSNKSQGYMGYMDLDVYKKAIDELEGNVEAITLASRGEPLLHPKIIEILSYTGNKFLGFKLNTNASLMDEGICHALLQSGLRTLVFSIDAADKKMYEKIRVNGKFEQTYKNIQRFSKIRSQQYPDNKMSVKVSGVKFLTEGQNLENLINFWGEYVDDVAFVHYNPWESAYENNINSITKPCTELWRRMFLWHDGTVNPCDYDYKSKLFKDLKVNINDISLKDVWNSNYYNKLRERHLKKERIAVEPCNRCVSI